MPGNVMEATVGPDSAAFPDWESGIAGDDLGRALASPVRGKYMAGLVGTSPNALVIPAKTFDVAQVQKTQVKFPVFFLQFFREDYRFLTTLSLPTELHSIGDTLAKLPSCL